mgnify:FL=1
MATSIFLVPGFPLFTGALDVTRLDLQAGIERITYAAVVMLSMGIAAWSVASIVGLDPSPAPIQAGIWWLVWIMRTLTSFLAVFGWAVMFNSPWREAVAGGLVAVLGNLLRHWLMDHGVVNHLATFAGALVIGIGCHAVARLLGLTRLIMLVPTLLVMIPGSAALRALLYFNDGDLMAALNDGISVVLQALAMVCGLVASMMMFDKGWAFTRPHH